MYLQLNNSKYAKNTITHWQIQPILTLPYSLTQKKTVATRVLLKCKILEQNKRHKVWQVASKLIFLS